MLPSGRWATLDCSTPLPYACLAEGTSTQWVIDVNTVGAWKGASAPCPAGAVPSVPHNGYTNTLLNVASYGQTVWLNTLPEVVVSK
jgi:hypothetical protein